MRTVESKTGLGPPASAQMNGGKARLPKQSLGTHWNENGIVKGTSDLLSWGNERPLRT